MAGVSIFLLVVGGFGTASPAREREPRLPAHGPVPQARQAAEPPSVEEPPLPSVSPGKRQSSAPQPLPAASDVPLPSARPRSDQPRDGTSGGGRLDMPTAIGSRSPAPSIGRHNARNLTPRIDDRLVEADQACRARLKAIGVVFEARPPLADPQGCSLPFPIAVSRLADDIALQPEAVLNCPMAEAAAKFATSVISPAAEATYKARLKEVANASAYVCRPRNGTSKLSEHAFGNALDMARFVLTDGTAIDVAATSDPKAGKFLADIRKAACGPFKTVLGPGSDADHALHFHFDLAFRRGGATFCQ